jgi:hypothetical protein
MDGRMNNTISIEKREAGTSGRCVGRIDGVGGPAELHFTIRGPKLISADHTEAPAMPEDWISLPPSEFYRDNRIDLRLSATVERLNVESRELALSMSSP